MMNNTDFTITFTPKACEDIFHNALCNGLDYVQEYGIVLEYNEAEYAETKSTLDHPCYEDILMEMLRKGYKLRFKDYENDDESLNVEFTLETVRERVNKIPDWVKTSIIEENDDATTADVVLQTIAYNEIIFG